MQILWCEKGCEGERVENGRPIYDGFDGEREGGVCDKMWRMGRDGMGWDGMGQYGMDLGGKTKSSSTV